MIGTGVAAVAVPGAAGFVAAEFQGGQAGELADVVGGDLVDGNAVADICASGLAGLDSGEEAGVGPGMVAASVPVGVGFGMFQPLDDLELALHVLQWGEAPGEFVGGAVFTRRPMLPVFAIGRIDKRQPDGGRRCRCGLSGSGGTGGEWGRAFQCRKGHQGSKTTKKAAAGEGGGHGELRGVGRD